MLCEDEDGVEHEMVVKLRAGIDLRETGLVCESLASLLATDLALPAPSPAIVIIEEEIVGGIVSVEFANLIRQSVGLNFGTKKLPAGLNTWPRDRAIPILLRPLAAEIFAFDAIIQNPDRRRDNPNIQWRGGNLYVYDHDLAFSFVVPIIGWQPPWINAEMGFLEEHIFYRGLRGVDFDLQRLRGAFENITDDRLDAYLETIPAEWRHRSDSAAEIITYLAEARRNLNGIENAIRRMLR